MFPDRISRRSPAEAWLAASQIVQGLSGHEAHHVVIDVLRPLADDERERAVIAEVDAYLALHSEKAFPVRTVANTIFPQSTYEDYGTPDFYDVYLKRIFPKLKQSPADWGRYFERMTAYPGPDGPLNLLDILVRKMKRHVDGGTTFRNIYELPIYNPVKDAEGRTRGGQCLSYMSLKLDKKRRLLLSAFYRNHYYTEKLLGNIVGLARLMDFVARETGATVGEMTILSTHATVDTAGGFQADLNALHSRCSDLLLGGTNVAAA